MKVVETLADLVACLGEEVAVSDWLAVTQERIDRFADRHRGPPVGYTSMPGVLRRGRLAAPSRTASWRCR